MPRTVVVLSRRRSAAASEWQRICDKLVAVHRPLPDTEERLGTDHIEFAFPRHTDIWDARVEVARWLDEIEPAWQDHVSMTLGGEPPATGIPDELRPSRLRGRPLPRWRELLLAIRGR